ncbi:Actin- protein 6 [Scheffersomyces spartinae]|uniref:Actin-like protein ARP6 n=1 Tax=Scheffersomyces spartinae TaxID=45513 RepID=A0A9P7VCX3_9ASCO|nr:Actin- protein 6 [Scheffersomyces spartinae]KAG7195009.1 Actin- protein 6 [Scheffersomyces spartinae]
MTFLVIDNGSYNIKAGIDNVQKVQNCISRARDGTVYIGNDYLPVPNAYSGLITKRPIDQGHLTSWEIEKPIWDYTLEKIDRRLDPLQLSLLLTEQPYQLPQLSMNTDQIVFEEYGFQEYYRCIPAALVPWAQSASISTEEGYVDDFELVIDSGFQATWIVPMIYQNVYWNGIKKLPIGGNLLNGLLRETISFRHYDMTEEPILINTIKENALFMAKDFNKALKEKVTCDFVLPDFKTTTTGYVKKPNEKLPNDTQVLRLSDERFVIPETFYHPERIFDNSTAYSKLSTIQEANLKNITDLVIDSIMECPEVSRPLLSANISLVGGNINIPNFKHRLVDELKKELPSEYSVNVKQRSYKPEDVAWNGGVSLSQADVMDNLKVTKKEYFEHGANWCQKQFGFKR